MDLPQLYQRPSASTLLSTLSDLKVEPTSWDNTPKSPTKRRKVSHDGVPAYLTRIVSSRLAWIEDEKVKEQIWEAASARLSERSGRSAMGDLTRTFKIPIESFVIPENEADKTLKIELHEPALTADNLGLKTWASSYLLAKRFFVLKDQLPKCSYGGGDEILELGSGTGLVGLAAAATFRAHTVLTDLPDIVPNLERNRLANTIRIEMRSGTAETAVLDWRQPEGLVGSRKRPRNSFKMIVAADPIYSSEHPRQFVQTVNCHLKREKEASVVLEMPLREAYAEQRKDLRQRMEKLGLKVIDEGEEVGYDDWSDSKDGERKEVRCWWSVWTWG